MCGNARPAGNDEPTMWLDLSKGSDRYKEHLVVHEFGHALGLGHEHQRSDFWKCIAPYLDKTEMEKDKEVGAGYINWLKNPELDTDKATDYDSQSVMHYWLVIKDTQYYQHVYNTPCNLYT